MKLRVIISVPFFVLAICSCRNTTKKSEEFVLANTDSVNASVNPGVDAMEEIYRNFSSPLEIANLFQVMKQYPDNLLRERIGEQKYFLEDLIRVVSPYCGYDKEFTTVCSCLRDIASKYENVKISYTKGDPSSIEKDGVLVVTQTETSMVEMTDEQLTDIIDITGNVRNKLIAN